MLRWFEHGQVFRPTRTLVATGAELGRRFDDVRFSAGHGVELHGWFYPAPINSPRVRWAVLVCHGNGGNISHRLGLYAVLLELGLNVFAFDYRGYGRSTGRPSEPGTYQDAQAACGWLQSRGFPSTSTIAFGESLGGGVASELALRVSLGGLVLQSTFTSIPDLGAKLFPWLPVRSLAAIHYDTYSKLPRVRVPLLVMHSREDRLVPFEQSQRNFAAAREPKLFCEIQGRHSDPLSAREPFLSGLENFMQLLEQSRPTVP